MEQVSGGRSPIELDQNKSNGNPEPTISKIRPTSPVKKTLKNTDDQKKNAVQPTAFFLLQKLITSRLIFRLQPLFRQSG